MGVGSLSARSCLIDGEAIVCDKNGLAVFELIRGHRTLASAVLCAFDLLELDGQDLRRESKSGKRYWQAIALFASEYRAQRALRGGRRDCLSRGLPVGLRGHRVEATWLALSFGTFRALGEGQKSESARGHARGGGGLGTIGTKSTLPHYRVRTAMPIPHPPQPLSPFKAPRPTQSRGAFLVA
jgi:hypothetical protein